jgi:Leucine-rich repeat (LRR) protein
MNKNMLLHGISSLVNLLVVASLGLSAFLGPVSMAAAAAVQAPLYAPFTTCADVTEIPQTECEALLAFYNSTDGANWVDNTGWLQTDTPCSWYGIMCADGHVTMLLIFSNQLTGTIPSALENLSNLNTLCLWDNQLSGSIPPQLGNLSNLNALCLDLNKFSGDIPSELGNLTQLQMLSLSGNQLTGNIPPVGKFDSTCGS